MVVRFACVKCVSAVITTRINKNLVDGNMYTTHPMRAIISLAVAGLLCSSSPGASQTDYPNRPITVIVPFAPGGPSDTVARLVSGPLSRQLGQPIVIQNVAGGGGTVGTLRTKRAAPDGYTIMTGQTGTHAAAVAFQPSLPYNPITDFTPIGLMTRMPVVVLGRRDFPPSDLKEFMSYLKANSHRLEEGHAGPSSISFVSCLLLNQILDVRPRLVPHDGAALANEALIAGQVDYMCDQLMDAVPAARAKRVKVYAVSSPDRSPALPDVPTTSEAGLPNYEVITWIALFGPSGIPIAIQDRLNRAISKALDDDSVRQQLVASGGDIPAPSQRTQQSLSELVKEDIARWTAVGKMAGMLAK
jgi:tripartite-type tricarboxylate transporter receptor subunit TctC